MLFVGLKIILQIYFSKLSILPIIPVVGINYKFQPILVDDVADAIVQAIEMKGNEEKNLQIGGPKIISFGDMVKSILKTINKKRFVGTHANADSKNSKHNH